MTLPYDTSERHTALLSEIVSSLESVEASLSGMQAVRAGLLAAAESIAQEMATAGDHPDYGELAYRSVAAEIGAALRLSDRTVQGQMGEAAVLAQSFPDVLAAQGRGLISAAHARIICEAGAHLNDPADREAFQARVLGVAETQTPGRLRVIARRIAEEFQDRSLQERHDDARKRRCVRVVPLDDGMAELIATLPAVIARGIHDRLSQMAHIVKVDRQKTGPASSELGVDELGVEDSGVEDSGVDEPGADEPGAEERRTGESSTDASRAGGPSSETPGFPERDADERGVDALRADLLSEMLLTATPQGHDTAGALLEAITARVEVTVPVLTLIGDDDAVPAELAGHGPIDAETARVLAGGAAGWDRVLTHPVSGAVLSVDRYRPGEELRRHLRVRDRRCRFPGCGISASRCDLDHTIDAAHGGATSDRNLAALCRRHHVLKHHSRWRVRQFPGGIVEFTSPAGRVYSTHPPGVLSGGPPATTVHFTTGDAAPF